MARTWRWLLAVPLVLASIGAGIYAYLWLSDRHRAKTYAGELMCCITGADPVAPADATTAARRMPSHHDGSLDDCADVLATTNAYLLGRLSKDLQLHVEELRDAEPGTPIPELAPLYRLLTDLDVDPSGCDTRPARPLLTELSAARGQVGGTYWGSFDVDRQPLDRVIVSGAEPAIAFEPDEGGHAVARAVWQGRTERSSRWPVDIRAGERGSLRRGDDEVPYGSERPLAALTHWVLWRAGGTLSGRRIVDDDAIVSEEATVLTLPTAADDLGVTACPLATGDILALEESSHDHGGKITIVEATDTLRVWGSYSAGNAGEGEGVGRPAVACAADRVTVAWAHARPDLRGRVAPHAVRDVHIPQGPQRQLIQRVTCTPKGCGQVQSAALDDLPGRWQSRGGWSSPMFLLPVAVEPLGERLLLWWSWGTGLFVRVAALDELADAPIQRLLDVAWPEKSAPFVPSAANWPEIETIRRGDALLMLIRETHRDGHDEGATLFVRLDASGAARLLYPTSPRPASR